MAELYRLICTSIANSQSDADELVASVFREAQGTRLSRITGVVLLHGRRILQLLEGESGAVTSCHDRIAADPRLGDLALHSMSPVQSRAFFEWHAGRLPETEAIAAKVEELLDALGHGASSHDPRRATELMQQLSFRDYPIEDKKPGEP